MYPALVPRDSGLGGSFWGLCNMRYGIVPGFLSHAHLGQCDWYTHMISVPCPFFGAFAASCMLSDVEAKSQYIFTYMDILQIYYGYTCNIMQLYCIYTISLDMDFWRTMSFALKEWTIREKEGLRLPKWRMSLVSAFNLWSVHPTHFCKTPLMTDLHMFWKSGIDWNHQLDTVPLFDGQQIAIPKVFPIPKSEVQQKWCEGKLWDAQVGTAVTAVYTLGVSSKEASITCIEQRL